tara:strand:- start:15671 stop:16426 length:756 start_codon:yes stop_codon:yes gene_type:complete
MLLGIRDINLISDNSNINNFKKLLGDGSQYGINLNYILQDSPNGIAESLVLKKEINEKDDVALILGDNIFYGSNIYKIINDKLVRTMKSNKSLIVVLESNEPEKFGNAVFDKNEKIINIEEKPKKPKSNKIVTGLYFYKKGTYKIVEKQKPNISKNNELCITDLNCELIKQDKLDYLSLGRGFTWFDSGTYDGYLRACNFIKIIESKSNELIGSIEEVALRKNFIDKKKYLNLVKNYKNEEYRQTLLKINP